MHRHTTTTIDRALARSIRITDADVVASQTLREVAADFVSTYRGQNTFVHDIAVKLADYGTLTPAQMRGALNVMIAEARIQRAAAKGQRTIVRTYSPDGTPAFDEDITATAAPAVGISPQGGVYIDLRSARATEYDAAFGDGAAYQREREDRAVEAAVTAAALTNDQLASEAAFKATYNAPVTPTIPNGYYTVILNEDGAYRTLRIETADTKRFDKVAPGTQIVSFLSGADNENSYTGFAFLMGNQYSLWKRFRNARDLGFALARLVADVSSAAAEYTRRSNNCFVCGRRLTVWASIAAGIGPVCRNKIAAFDIDLTQLARAAQSMTAAERDAAKADMDELFND